MEKNFAILAKEKSLEAIRCLNEIIKLTNDWDSDQMKLIRRGIGMSIISVDEDVLNVIYRLYPDLDDLNKQ